YKFQDRKILRLTWPVLDRAPTTKPQETILLQEVEDFKVQFYGPAGGWLTNWPPTGTAPPPALPRAVEVTVTLPGKGELKRVFLVSG
ncbi:MAG: type II secretion system protein GspJ, partial [Pseudomonadota bacterium]